MGGADLAIKKLDLESMQEQTEFLQEVQVLGACRHVNLTPLLGFAADTGPALELPKLNLTLFLGFAADTG